MLAYFELVLYGVLEFVNLCIVCIEREIINKVTETDQCYVILNEKEK